MSRSMRSRLLGWFGLARVSDELRDIAAERRAIHDLLGRYGDALTAKRGLYGRVRDLPADPATLKWAALAFLDFSRGRFPESLIEATKIGFVELANFLPDDDYAIVAAYDDAFAKVHNKVAAGQTPDLQDLEALARFNSGPARAVMDRAFGEQARLMALLLERGH